MSLALASPTRSASPQLAFMNGFQIEPEKKGRVLIVDDSRLVRSVFLNTLSANYDCMAAQSYDEAVECLKMFEFDLVIADVIMPGLSGTELLRKVVENYPETAVIMVSGVDRPQRALDALRLGAFDYLIKPCELPVLELTVERALENRNLRRNAEKYKQALESRNIELEKGKADRQQLQTQIVQNEKMAGLGQIAAGIAHELNNPVAFVHGNLEILGQATTSLVEMLKFYESCEMPAEIAMKASELKGSVRYLSSLNDLDEIIADCREGSERIRDIVQNLRTFSRLDEAEFKKADVNSGIDSTARLLSQYFNHGKINLVRDYAELPQIDAFGGQLNQVWMNLLVNAAQAIGSGRGDVKITTKLDGDGFVSVTIADTGGGIATQHLNRVFEPFYTTKEIGEGTGLGLSICFGIVERHGGTISVESSLGNGTAFTVRLPVHIEHDPIAEETAITTFKIVENQPKENFHYEPQNTYC